MKSFGECCGCTMLTAACYWPSFDYIPTQTFVSVSAELNHDCSLLVLDADKGVCIVITYRHNLYEFDRWSPPSGNHE